MLVHIGFRKVSPASCSLRGVGAACVTSNALPFSGPLLVSRVTAQSIQTNFAEFPRDGCSNNSSNRGSLIDILILNDAAVPALWEAQLAGSWDPMPGKNSLTPTWMDQALPPLWMEHPNRGYRCCSWIISVGFLPESDVRDAQKT